MLLQIPGNAGDGALLRHIGLGGGFALKQGNFQIVDAGSEFLVVHGLEDIVRDLQPESLPAIGKVVISGYDDKGGVRVLDPAELNHLQAVHNGNVDVHDGNIRVQVIHFGQSLHAVGGLSHHLTAVTLPVKKPLEAFPDHNFVIHKQNSQFFHCISSSRGSRMWAVTPPSGFSVYQSPYFLPHSSLMRFCTFRIPMLLPVSLGGSLA